MRALDRRSLIRKQKTVRKLSWIFAVFTGGLWSTASLAAEDSQVGYITNVTFDRSGTLIMLSAGVPDNCTGTPYGWMRIADTSKTITAFVLGLWLRGDVAQTTVSVYTAAAPSPGDFCVVTQIDPAN